MGTANIGRSTITGRGAAAVDLEQAQDSKRPVAPAGSTCTHLDIADELIRLFSWLEKLRDAQRGARLVREREGHLEELRKILASVHLLKKQASQSSARRSGSGSGGGSAAAAAADAGDIDGVAIGHGQPPPAKFAVSNSRADPEAPPAKPESRARAAVPAGGSGAVQNVMKMVAQQLGEIATQLQPGVREWKARAKTAAEEDVARLEEYIDSMAGPRRAAGDWEEQAKGAREEARGERERREEMLRRWRKETARGWRRVREEADSAGRAAVRLAQESEAQLRGLLDESLPDSADTSALEPEGEEGACGPMEDPEASGGLGARPDWVRASHHDLHLRSGSPAPAAGRCSRSGLGSPGRG
eukprot:tig00000821_g4463.t1